MTHHAGIDRIRARSGLIARASEKWMSVYRCHTCGQVWVEANASSGQMDIAHLSPMPPTDGPLRWLRDRGAALPFRAWL